MAKKLGRCGSPRCVPNHEEIPAGAPVQLQVDPVGISPWLQLYPLVQAKVAQGLKGTKVPAELVVMRPAPHLRGGREAGSRPPQVSTDDLQVDHVPPTLASALQSMAVGSHEVATISDSALMTTVMPSLPASRKPRDKPTSFQPPLTASNWAMLLDDARNMSVSSYPELLPWTASAIDHRNPSSRSVTRFALNW